MLLDGRIVFKWQQILANMFTRFDDQHSRLSIWSNSEIFTGIWYLLKFSSHILDQGRRQLKVLVKAQYDRIETESSFVVS